MIALCCALPPEAAALTEYFKLKRDFSVHGHEFFRNDCITLIVSGAGKVRAAIATTRLLSCAAPPLSAVLNIGVCGADPRFPRGQVFFVNKITDSATGRTYLPDIIFPLGLGEASLHTVDAPHTAAQLGFNLVDMEASGFFEAAQTFLPQSRIGVLKVVSDHFNPGEVTRLEIERLITSALPSCAAVLTKYEDLSGSAADQPLAPELQFRIQELSANLNMSTRQTELLTEWARGFVVHGGDAISILNSFQEIQFANKFQTKEQLERLKRLLTPPHILASLR